MGTVQLFLGSALAVFAIATIFWAGATYNRVSAIENRLGKIEDLLQKFSELVKLQQWVTDHERRLQKLEG